MGFYLEKDEALDEGFTRIAREQILKVIENLGDDSLPLHEKVHSLRSRCKRLRALLRLARPAMARRYAEQDRRFRDAARRLCYLRDAYVMHQTLASLAKHHRPDSEALVHPDDLDPEILRKSRKDMLKALAAVDRWHLKAPGFYAIAGGLGHTWDETLHAWESCQEEPSDEHFHRLRRWAKYLLFQTAILQPLEPTELGAQRERLHELGEQLGTGHDLAVLEHVLTSSGETNEALLQHAAAEKRQRYDDSLALCAAIFDRSADRVVADVSDWWADWHQSCGS